MNWFEWRWYNGVTKGSELIPGKRKGKHKNLMRTAICLVCSVSLPFCCCSFSAWLCFCFLLLSCISLTPATHKQFKKFVTQVSVLTFSWYFFWKSGLHIPVYTILESEMEKVVHERCTVLYYLIYIEVSFCSFAGEKLKMRMWLIILWMSKR